MTQSTATATENATAARRPKLPPLPPLPITLSEDVRRSHGFDDAAHWVVPDVLMQGSRPGFGLDVASELPDRVRAIVEDAGCQTFVSLQAECVPEDGSVLLGDGGHRKPNPKDLPVYADLVSSVAGEIEGRRAQFLYYGIVGMQTAPSVDGLSDAVSDLAARIRSGGTGPVYVHCGGGVGRAGLLCACLLGALYDDLGADEAMEYTTAFCHLRNVEGKEEKRYSSPETEGQKEQVREFFEKMRTAARHESIE